MISQCLIRVKLSEGETFTSTVRKLLDVGFVFSDHRLRTVGEIRKRWWHCDTWEIIKVGYNPECKIVLHAVYSTDSETIDVDTFLNILKDGKTTLFN